MKRKILPVLLSLCMVLTIMPMVAFAEGTDSFEALKEAIDNAEEGATVKLTSDVVIPAGVENNIILNQAITIDGNGHEIIRSFNNVNVDGYGDYEAIFSVQAAGVTIKNVKMSGLAAGMKDEAAVYISANGTAEAKIVIENCVFVGAASVEAESGGSGIISAGKTAAYLDVLNNTFTNVKHGMWFNGISNATIDGNTLNGVKYTGIRVEGGSNNVTITNNTMTDVASKNYAYDEFASGIWVGEGSKVTLNNNNIVVNASASNGKAVVVEGGYGLAALKEAIDSAEAGATVTLTSDVVIPAGVENNIILDKAITIDGAGYEIIRSFNTASVDGYGDYEAIFSVQAAGVTIRNVKMSGLAAGMKDEAAVYISANGTAEAKIVIENCVFVGAASVEAASGGSGIISAGNTANYLDVLNNTFTNVKHGMWFNGISNATINGNTLNGVKYTGIRIEGGSENVTITNNTMTDVASANYAYDEFASGIWVGERSTVTLCDNAVSVKTGATNGKTIVVEGNENCAVAHMLDKTAARQPTYSEAGNHEYYTCSICKKVFKDINCTTETTVEAETIAKLVSGGSSGGGSSSSSNSSSSNVTNPDGSTTTTVTDKNTGTVTETTKNTDGSSTSVETKKDGTVTTTETAADGSTSKTVENPDGSSETNVKQADGTTASVTTDKDGNTEAKVDVSTQAASEAAESGGAVALPIPPVTAGTSNSDNAPTIDINVPGDAGKIQVEIPVDNVTSGTVVIVVNEDGTETVIKKSAVTDEGLLMTVTGDVTVKIVDNSQNFNDVKGSDWHSDAVDFVSARSIFNGTGNGNFAPDGSMTRGMLAQVLYNLEDNPNFTFDGSFTDVADSEWYADAVHWAAQENIVTGYTDGSYGANDSITREQLAVMLWRYAGSPDSSSSLSSFSDAEQISSYAQEALTWANEMGIINGMGDGTLNPKGEATRAQVAQMLMNFCSEGLM